MRSSWRWRLLLALLITGISSLIFSGCIPLLDKYNKAGLQVITNDIPSSIFLNGQYLDKTPFIGKEIKPDTYTLKIQPDDNTLVPYETSINLRQGLLTVVTWKPGTRPELSGGVIYELEKIKKKQTELSIVSVPDGAIVSIDGGEKEFAPFFTSTITAGSHEIEISLPSYETQQHTINVVAGHRLNVSVKLAKNPEPGTTPVPATNPLSATVATPSAAAPKTPAASSPSQSGSASSSATKIVPPFPGTGGKQVSITATNFFQNGKEVLRVREASSSAAKELGFVEVGKSYPYGGASSKDWHSIIFESKMGWVSAIYSKLEP